MKYVILMQQVGGAQGLIQLFPVLFPEQLSHYEVASQPLNGKRATPVAAGFCTWCSLRDSRFGEREFRVDMKRSSTSLQMNPGPFDQDIINDIFTGGNVINMSSLWTEHPHYRDNFHRFSWEKLDKALAKAAPRTV